jgi:SpoIID/LytB domain protein
VRLPTATRTATILVLTAPLMGLLAAAPQAPRPVAAPAGRPQPLGVGRETAFPVIPAPATVRVGVALPGSQRSYTVRHIPIEQYVAGVLVGEAARDSQPAVLEALAVAIRTYALKNLNRHNDEGFDVCDQTHCQVLRTSTPTSADAAAKTSGQVLTWGNALALVYYSASCGGHSEIPSAVWPGAEDPPYLPARSDDGCGGTPEWTLQLRTSQVERALIESGYRGSLNGLNILSRDSSGRVARFGLDGLTPTEISGQDLRMAVGAQRLKSTALEMRPIADGYEFSGRGYGHGVGMCVIGATRLAERGERSQELLARYFPGTTVGVIQAEGVVPVRPDAGPSAVQTAQRPAPMRPPAAAVPVSPPGPAAAPAVPPLARAGGTAAAVPDETARARQELESLAARVRAELSGQVGVPGPTLILRVHTSDADYERATGRDWFTWGALVGDELHLMPLVQLRQQGLLERIVRRETAHRLIDEALMARPRWVRDGLALHFADTQRSEVEVSGACPTDDELANPLSVGALAQAYARARACVSRQIAAGRSWRDVR